jgi:hypothetical protein
MSFLILAFCCDKDRSSPSLSAGNDELAIRIKMSEDRILHGKEPAISENFLLAGLTLDPKFQRRFTNYSGDQCGRYLSAFSKADVINNQLNMQHLVQNIIANQKADGRFGSEDLDFSSGRLEGDHMALLWGNGRLLTGLLDYYEASQDAAALEAAVKSGNFLISISKSCMQADVVEKFQKKGAMGFICFTQNIEGLVKLSQATGKTVYIEHGLMPSFMAEPAGGNVLLLIGGIADLLKKEIPEERFKNTRLADGYLGLNYRHKGFYGESPVILRPLSEITQQRPANVRLWFNCEIKHDI